MEPNIKNFNSLTEKEYNLINEIIEVYNKNNKLLGGFLKCYKKDNEFAGVLEKENNNILANELKKEQSSDVKGIKILMGDTEKLLLKSKQLDLEKKLKNNKDNDEEKNLLEKINKHLGGYNKINKNLNKQLIKLGIEYYKRQYLRYKLKYIFDF